MDLTRRQTFAIAGAGGAALAFGRFAPDLTSPDEADAASCIVTPAKEEGPFFVDERLNRANITTDPASGVAQPGVPLVLTVFAFRADDGCTPFEGATVDLWHANATGLYSDEASQGTAGQRFLRGHQVTDENGAATFTTIYPGWYSGRTIHIHARVRMFDGSSTTYDFETQLFFDDAISDQVMAVAPYSARGARDTTNASDRVYGGDGGQVTMSLGGSTVAGYTGSIAIGLQGLPAASGGATDDAPTADGACRANVMSARIVRTAHGKRVLRVRVKAHETVTASATLLRSGKTIALRRGHELGAGTRDLAVEIGPHVRAGAALLRLQLTDRAGNTKVVRKRLQVPRRLT